MKKNNCESILFIYLFNSLWASLTTIKHTNEKKCKTMQTSQQAHAQLYRAFQAILKLEQKKIIPRNIVINYT